jgi:hypothetical protein
MIAPQDEKNEVVLTLDDTYMIDGYNVGQAQKP